MGPKEEIFNSIRLDIVYIDNDPTLFYEVSLVQYEPCNTLELFIIDNSSNNKNNKVDSGTNHVSHVP